MHLYELTIHQAHGLLEKRQVSAVELTRAVLERIGAVEGRIDAFIRICPETALEQAAEADRAVSQGRIGPLTGIPLAVKDLICTRGIPTTCASRILENFTPPYDATVIERLRRADAVFIGKANMDEFAMGSTTENSAFKTTRNPWDRSRVPGGSSGGSAAAVAAGMCLAALGSDTGGSIRQPAAHCGVVGMKPTYGRVSRYGLVAFASSLDQIGPITRDVADCALVMNAICGHDPLDSTSAPEPVPDFTAALDRDLSGLTLGIPEEYFAARGLNPEVADAVSRAADVLEGLGARRAAVSLPHALYGVAAYYVIAPCEASSNLARYDGVKYGNRIPGEGGLLDLYRQTRSAGFGPEVQRRIILGTYALSAGYYDAYYRKASLVRTRIREDFARAFERCDVILAPVAPTPAPCIGDAADDPLAMYLSDMFTLSANLAGIPGMSVPCGFSAGGLPIGLQLLGRHFREQDLIAVAHAFERAAGFHGRMPAL